MVGGFHGASAEATAESLAASARDHGLKLRTAAQIARRT